jgi:hypothetical protein
MESLARLMVSAFELIEAEGRVLKQSLMRLAIAIALGILVSILTLAGIGFLFWGLFAFLADEGRLGTAGAATLFGVVSLAMAIGGSIVVRWLVFPPLPKKKDDGKDEVKTPTGNKADGNGHEQPDLNEARERAAAHEERIPNPDHGRIN